MRSALRNHLALLDVEERVRLNEYHERMKVALRQQVPIIISFSFFSSIIYSVATRPSMKSIVAPTIKGTLTGITLAYGYYRWRKVEYDRVSKEMFASIVSRKYRS